MKGNADITTSDGERAMKQPEESKASAFKYLLGKMAEDEASRYEELYFTDAAALERLQIAQDELIEAYLGDELPEGDRQLFDTNFLAAPAHRKQLELTRALIESAAVVAKEKAPASRAPAALRVVLPARPLFDRLRRDRRLWVAAAALLLLIIGLLLMRGRLHGQNALSPEDERAASNANTNSNEHRPDVAQGNHPTENRNDSALPAANSNQRKSAAANQMAVFLLTGASRSIETEKPFVIEPTVKAVRLQVVLPAASYDIYKIMIRPADGGAALAQGEVRPARLKSGRVITVEVPAERFASQAYRLQLEGVSAPGAVGESDQYYFRIVKRDGPR